MTSLKDVRSMGSERAESFIQNVSGKNCFFVCVISYTETCEIPGITVAGADPELIKYTPAADAEFLYHGECRCIETVPATPDGKPTPALITRAALKSAEIPLVVVDAGSKVKPDLPYFSLGLEHHGGNIADGRALDTPLVRKAFEKGVELGSTLARAMKHIVIGESIPAGTTTALGVLLAMGIDAKYRVSSSMPRNPHELKLATVERGMKAAGLGFGSLAGKPFEAVSCLGDPMIPSVAGIAVGASTGNSNVMLAGGTQMAVVLSFIDAINRGALEKMVVGTTRYIVDDQTSDILQLISSASSSIPIPLLSCDPHLERSGKEGLRAYADGFVKDGVGAGGACTAAMLKSRGAIDGDALLGRIESEYESVIWRPV
ncbi:MAG: nicotinate mononucleotide-dependent phosphoribosyltransferase CobT [Nitrososphaerales archaeon]